MLVARTGYTMPWGHSEERYVRWDPRKQLLVFVEVQPVLEQKQRARVLPGSIRGQAQCIRRHGVGRYQTEMEKEQQLEVTRHTHEATAATMCGSRVPYQS